MTPWGIPEGSIILVYEISLEQEDVGTGSNGTTSSWGVIVSAPHQLYQLPGADADKVLFLPSGDVLSMEWAGTDCPEDSGTGS
jgi:hypothetical protein